MFWQNFRLYGLGRDIVSLFVVTVLIAGIFMWIGSRIARIHSASLLRALLAAFLGTLTAWIVRDMFGTALPVAGAIFGFLAGFLLVLLIIKAIFDTSLIRATVVWIFFIIARPAVVLLLRKSFFADIRAFIWRGLPF